MLTEHAMRFQDVQSNCAFLSSGKMNFKRMHQFKKKIPKFINPLGKSQNFSVILDVTYERAKTTRTNDKICPVDLSKNENGLKCLKEY